MAKAPRSATKSKRSAPPSAPAPPLPPTRVIALKTADRHDGSIDGIADLTATRWMCFGLAIICIVLAIGLPSVIILVHPGPDPDPRAIPVAMLVAAPMLFLVFVLTRAGLRVGAWVSVDPAGIDYGEGKRDSEKDRQAGRPIEWTHIVAEGAASCDVRLILVGASRTPKQARIAFRYRSPDGPVAERSIPMSLTETPMRCLRFVNADVVRIALLKSMAAACPGLRFDPAIFVEAGIDPETWHSMPRPHGIEWLIVGASIAAVLIFGSFVSKATPLAVIVGGVFAVLGASLFATFAFRKAAYPGFSQAIRFRAED